MKYNFDEIHNRKGTFSTQWDYIADRFGRSDILPFSISDTDFIIPYPVTEKLKETLKLEIFGYTRWNHATFKNAIIHYFKRHFHTEIKEEWIVYAPSVMYSLSTLMSMLTKEEDNVAAFSPMYTDFEDAVLSHHRHMIRVPLLNQDGYYQIDFSYLEEVLKKVKVFLLCSPHNPTGRVWLEEELVKFIELCKKYNVKIISDEIHMDVILQGKHLPILNFYPQYQDIYLVSSGSKTFNYPSLGGSYAIIPNEEIRNQFLNITKHRDFVNSANYMGMMALITSYNDCDDYREQLVQYIRKNMKIVETFINEKCSPLKFIQPEGTYLAWIDCRDLPFSCEQLQEALINIGKVGIMKGEVYFGNHYLRMNCGCPKEKLIDGLQRLQNSIEYLYQNVHE